MLIIHLHICQYRTIRMFNAISLKILSGAASCGVLMTNSEESGLSQGAKRRTKQEILCFAQLTDFDVNDHCSAKYRI